MRILVAIPHFFGAGGRPAGEPSHGSLGGDRASRVEALTACVAALRQHFGGPQVMIDIATRQGMPANLAVAPGGLDVIVCTTRGEHLLTEVPLPEGAFRHHPADVEPRLLGFECHAALHERIGEYDYYCYMEDDLIVRDAWFFAKLEWFNNQVGPASLLAPNRYEVAREGVVLKAYIDGGLFPGITAPFQDVSQVPELRGTCLGVETRFRRPTNPHSGCFFLNAIQMRSWALRDDFLDRDTRFVGPLESAATFGVMRAFRVYKPAPEVAGFLEIEHAGTGFIRHLRRRSDVPEVSA